MRKSTSRTRSRLVFAGIATGAFAAALLVAPQAAFAAVTQSPTSGLLGQTLTITDTNTLTATPAVQLSVAACATTYTTPTTGIVNATNVNRVDANTLTFTVPTTLPLNTSNAAKTYNTCVYVGTVAGTSAYVASLSAGTYTAYGTSQTSGPLGQVLTITDNTSPITSTTPGVQFRTDGCASTFFTTPTTDIISATAISRPSTSTVTFTVPATLPLGTGNAPKAYNICVYNGTTNGSSALATTGTYNAIPTATFAPAAGPSGGGNAVTVTGPVGTIMPTTVGVMFAAGANSCPATYTSTGLLSATAVRTSNTAATVTVPIGVAATGVTASPYSVCLYSGNTTSNPVFATIAPAATYGVTLPAVAVNTPVGAAGSAGAGPSIIVSAIGNFLTGVAAPMAVFSTSACSATYPAVAPGTSGTAVLKSANNRAAIKVPAGVTVVGGPTPYNVCIYTGTSPTTDRLLATAMYTAATAPAITAVVPGAGSSLGGSMITVTGSAFPTSPGSIRATLGGVPLNNIIPLDANTFTAVTPVHAGELDVPLVVTTDTGTITETAAFDYLNGVEVSPNTASNTSDGVWLDVRGVGFESLTFGTGAFATGDARVALVDGRETGYSAGTTNAVGYLTGPTTECTSVFVISGNELFCKLDLNTGGLVTTTGVAQAAGPAAIVPNGTYSLTVISDSDDTLIDGAFEQSVVSSGSTFTVSDF